MPLPLFPDHPEQNVSYESTADQKRFSAIERVKGAINDLHAIVVEECEGHAEFTLEARDDFYECYRELTDILQRLRR